MWRGPCLPISCQMNLKLSQVQIKIIASHKQYHYVISSSIYECIYENILAIIFHESYDLIMKYISTSSRLQTFLPEKFFLQPGKAKSMNNSPLYPN